LLNPKSFRQFKTFTQELRLQGSAFNKKLDWLVGGYYANENLTLQDELRFGNQYGRFAACRLVSGSGLAPLYNPAAAGCLAARPAAFGAASPIIYAAIDRLDGISDRGSTGDLFKQNSRNFAVFTHNIFHITDRLDATIGVRYTNERKKLDASFGNDNVACAQNQAALTPFLANPASPLFVPAISIIRLSCFANISSEFNGVKINGKRKEHRFTGTGVLSYKPTDHLLLYGSASSGYKAGGFNLDKSALKNPEQTLASLGGAQAVASRLQFDPETVRAYEVGGKFTARGVTFNVALFRQDFKNFQLNTFDGTVFVVQNVNSCKTDLAGADRDLSGATGACNKDDVQYGVRSQGVEFETSYRPARDLNLSQQSDRSGHRLPARPGVARAAGPTAFECPAHGCHWIDRLHSADRWKWPLGAVLRRCTLLRPLQHGVRPVPAERSGGLHAGQWPGRCARARQSLVG